MRNAIWVFVIVLMAALSSVGVRADDDARDHDRARRALEAGEIMPLSRILDRVERDYAGRVLEVELEREDERWLYEIKLLQDGGQVLKLKVDARDAEVLSIKGRRAEKNRGVQGQP
ncbi:MAG TPA: PepSY domain-containing protein [Burkholderiales bacterium]|jgi:uncharacterized membrane protein YkoI